MLNVEKLERKCSKAAARAPGLTPEMVRRLQNRAHGIYEDIGGEMGAEGQTSERRKVVIEVVLDAGRLERDVRQVMKLDPKNVDHPMIRACRGAEIEDIVGPAFPYERYEVGCG